MGTTLNGIDLRQNPSRLILAQSCFERIDTNELGHKVVFCAVDALGQEHTRRV